MATAETQTTDRAPSNQDQLRSKLAGSEGFRLEDRGTFHTLYWKNPGSIFNFEAMREDKLVIGNGVAGTIDICRANAECLYLTVKGASADKRVDNLWRLLFKHHRPAVA